MRFFDKIRKRPKQQILEAAMLSFIIQHLLLLLGIAAVPSRPGSSPFGMLSGVPLPCIYALSWVFFAVVLILLMSCLPLHDKDVAGAGKTNDAADTSTRDDND